MAQDPNTTRPGFFRRLWQALNRPSAHFGAGMLLIAGIAIGAVSWQGFHVAVDQTNTLSFCTSCHSMEAYVYPEYAESAHYANTIGVRVTCADCHVPEAFLPKMYTKARATMVELPGHFLGRIATKEQFEQHKPVMAERVWARMQANDSRECRSCHSWEAMTEQRQVARARQQHAQARETEGTCIDCHKGIAHSLPDGYLEMEENELDFGF